MSASHARARRRPEPEADTVRDTRAAAADYIARGWAVVPVAARAKRPSLPDGTPLTGWERGGYSAEDVDPAGNVGLLLGEPSGGLVDIDLDCPEAIAAAPYYLPPTPMIHGRAGAPRSHRWYTVSDRPDITRTAYADPTRRDATGKLCMLLELRATGGQTVVPPSTHEDTGELIEWAGALDPAPVTADVLQRAVALVAAVALLAPRWPAGCRHDAALALAGTLLRGGMLEHDAERMLEVVARVAGDEEWPDRMRAAHDTAAKIAAGRPATGARRLAELLSDGEQVVARLRDWLGLSAADDTATTDETPPLDLWGAAELTGQPVLDLDMLPPVIARMALDESERLGVDPALLAIPALVVCSAAIDDGWQESARLWGAVVTEPGGRKTPALNRVATRTARGWRLINAEDLDRLIAERAAAGARRGPAA